MNQKSRMVYVRMEQFTQYIHLQEIQACSSGLAGVLLSIVGYTTATAFDPKVIDGIYNVTCLMPAAGMTLLLLALIFIYPLNKKRVEANAAKLKEIKQLRNSSKNIININQEELIMLYPVLTQSRLLSDLSGVWNFKLDNGKGFEEKWYEKPLKDADTMPVPASYNDLKEGIDFRDHYGWVFYQRNISVPEYVKSQRIVLRCAAVTHYAMIYLNGKLICDIKEDFFHLK